MSRAGTRAARGAAQSHTGAVAGDLAMTAPSLPMPGCGRRRARRPHGCGPAAGYPARSVARPHRCRGGLGAMRGLASTSPMRRARPGRMVAATVAALRELFPPFVTIDDPLDLGTAAFGKPEVMRRAAQLLPRRSRRQFPDPVAVPGRRRSRWRGRGQLLPAMRASQKPVALVMLGDPMPLDAGFMGLARAEGSALFRSTEQAVRAMTAVDAVARALAAPAGDGRMTKPALVSRSTSLIPSPDRGRIQGEDTPRLPRACRCRRRAGAESQAEAERIAGRASASP